MGLVDVFIDEHNGLQRGILMLSFDRTIRPDDHAESETVRGSRLALATILNT